MFVFSYYIEAVFGCVFFFKQKTAYEMRISYWSSDVCSSDLSNAAGSSRISLISCMFKPIKRDCGAGKRSMEIHKATGCASARLHCDGQKEMRNETGSRYLCCRGGWRQDAPLPQSGRR